jgi:hypothetical protein
LESTQKALSKRDFSSSVVISSVVAHVVALVKNPMPDFDAEILRRNFSINEVERDALVDSIYDTAHYFISQYDFSVLNESDDNDSHGA